MCFVGFVYFACGHNRIITQDCDVALTADTPFFIRHQCPDYRQTSGYPKFACGAGKFYCRETRDGPFLEHLHESVVEAQKEIARMDGVLVRMVESGQNLTQEADRRHVPMALRQQIPTFQFVATRHSEAMQQRENLHQSQARSQAVIEQAREYYAKMNQYLQNGGTGAYPPFVPSTHLFGRMPAEMALLHSAHKAAQGVYAPTLQQQPTIVGQNPQLPPSPVGSNIQVTQRRRAPNSHHPARLASRQLSHLSDLPPQARAIMQAQYEEAARQNQQAQNMQPPPSNLRKGGRPRKNMSSRARKQLAEDQEGMEDDGESVRRSVRVRNKKVNYAESAGSDVNSRDPSPEKSDASGFSPYKSDESASPSKGAKSRNQANADQGPREPRFNTNYLSEKLSDWTRRGNIAAANTPLQRRAMPGMKDLLNSSPVQVAPMSNAAIASPALGGGTPRLNDPPLMRSSTDPAALRYSMPNPTSLAATQQEPARFQTAMSANSMLTRPSMSGPLGQASFGLGTLKNPRQNVPPGVRDWLVQGQNIQNFTNAQLAPPQPMAPQAFNSHVQRSMLGPGAQPFAAPSTQPFSFRKDSVMSLGSPASQTVQSATPSNYASMRKSFSTGTALTPPTLPSSIDDINEPRKRSRAPSSVSTDNGKRMRLSLPGEETTNHITQNTDWLLGQSVDLSSALETVSHNAAGSDRTHELPSLYENVDLATAPAPRLAPTAVMSVAKPAFSGEDGAENAQLDLPRQQADRDDEAEEDHYGFDFSDPIDWGMPF